MVTTRAQEASTGAPVGLPPPARQQEVNPPAVDPLAPCPPPAGTAAPAEQLAALSRQLQTLTAMVHGLQQQQSVDTQHQTAPPAASQQSARGGLPHQEAGHRQASPKKPRHEPPKRPRSPGRNPRRLSPRPRHHEEPARRPHLPSPSSSSSTEPPKKTQAISHQAEDRLDEYVRRLDELTRRVNKQPEEDFDTRPPYTRRILEEPVPSRFRLPQMDPYDGTTDPLDHLESYKAMMQVQGASDALLCKAFPATLRKAARAWHSRLTPRSIDSFRELERVFLAHFDACRRIPKVADSLFSMQ